ncbi:MULTISPECIES: poly-gamma-glutamate biosynthesis protein PgsC/CapC [Mesotoga]|uniref:poly-gamma-glutamate biosynthesis protein PgsC/CapC n=1 Tax=Mesotoga TaxID=1184396 RepID=UPI002B59CB3E|nr:poly-gamma-glutamate biosynthesis protein PgsC/CapC [Mesotoga prima]HNQ69765.1 poly-gamma-glutamate biosynthesis protein PgsC/CapC [Mesotoga prima]HNS75118.1 poly-gamma-glutamate biosynthesis protein PgsC/CapC [Mesotoga prima]
MSPALFSIGIAISTAFWWVTGLSAGGLVTPVYLFIFMEQPLRLLYTWAVGLVTFLILNLLQRYLILYGRKRMALGIVLGVFVKLSLDTFLMPNLPVELFSTVIGTIVPGLIANDFYRQGIIKTSLSLAFVTLLLWLIDTLIRTVMVI